MSAIQFSKADLRNPFESLSLEIRCAHDPDCDGLICNRYHEVENGQPIPPRPHLHLIVQGQNPTTEPRYYAVDLPRLQPNNFEVTHDEDARSVQFKFTGPVEFQMSFRPMIARMIAQSTLDSADRSEGKETAAETREILEREAQESDELARREAEEAEIRYYEEWQARQASEANAPDFHAVAESIASTLKEEATMSERAEHIERAMREVWLQSQPDFHAIARSTTSSLTTPATMAERIENALRNAWSQALAARK
jgi:hypothetical protein